MAYIERIHNVVTGEITERPYSEDEIAEAKAAEARLAAENLELQNKETKRQAVLDKLGLSADEARLLLG